MPNLIVQIVQFVDSHQPGWVQCEFVDADGLLDDTVFDVAATILMSRMQRGVVYKKPPFDIEEFIKQVEKKRIQS